MPAEPPVCIGHNSYIPQHALYPIAVFDLATGPRRGELLALRLLVDVDIEAGTIHVRRSLEETKAGLRASRSPRPSTADAR